MKPQSRTTLAPSGPEEKNFGLTEAEFDQLVDQLRRGDDTLYRRVFLAHFGECLEYLRLHFAADHETAYDTAMDTLLEFCHRLRTGKMAYGNLRFLFTQMASQHLCRLRQDQQAFDHVETDELDLLAALDEQESRRAMQAFDTAWDRLGDGCQQLLAGYFYHQTTLREIAREEGRSEVAVRKQKQRCLDKLRSFFGTVYHV